MSQIHPLALDYSQRYYKSKYAWIFSSKESCTINTLKARAADQESMASSALVKFSTYNCFAGGFSLTAGSGEGFAQQQVVVLECWSWGHRALLPYSVAEENENSPKHTYLPPGLQLGHCCCGHCHTVVLFPFWRKHFWVWFGFSFNFGT